ncbi:MAG: hypothetical protein WAQ05_08385 [Rubrivivax sp.]
MKITVPTLKPRNPLVAMTRLRRAGEHRASAGSRRQQAGRELRLELQRLRPSP